MNLFKKQKQNSNPTSSFENEGTNAEGSMSASQMPSSYPLDYREIMYSRPYSIGKRQKRKKMGRLNALSVTLFFLVMMALFLTVGSLIQYFLGMAGLALTEVMFLVCSLAFVKIMGADFREVFPIRKPKWIGLAGVLTIWAGSFLASDILSVILMMLAPDELSEMSDSMMGTFGTTPPFVTFLIVACLPPVCEEAMHRGVIQTGIRNSVKNKWMLVLIMGAFFALYHIYPIRYLTIGFLGCVLSYILAESGNMVYSSFFHFVQNGSALLFSAIAEKIADPEIFDGLAETAADSTLLGSSLAIYGPPAILLLYAGAYLLKRAEAPVRPSFLPKGKEKKTLALLIGSCGGLFAAGVLIAAISMFFK
ncbi:MAG: type II CAAX endopeptidase family protein [Eubacterium sp.]|nr:type II CAAX endopeptidase family protein [Eubacterium sp.]